MKTFLILAWRNIWRNKRRTLITVSSVMFAVILAIIMLSIVNGFQERTLETVVRQDTGYLQIQDVLYHDEPSLDHSFEYGDEVRNALKPFENEIEFTVRRIQGFSLAAKDMVTKPALVMGIIPGQEDRMNNLSSFIVDGAMFTSEDNYAVVAKGLARMLNISIGDTLVLIGQGFQAMTAAGKYEVGGIVEFIIPERNNAMVYLPLNEAQWYFAAEHRLTNLIIMPRDVERVHDLAESMQTYLDDEWYRVLTWEELMPDIMGLLEMEEVFYKIMVWVLYIVIAFGIFGTILTMIYERKREFGILLSVGMKRYQLGFICFIETILICFIGVILGLCFGFPIVYYLHHNPIQFTGELADYMLNFGLEPLYPFSIAPDIFIYQAASIFAITMVVALYAVRKIFKLDILKAARN